MADETSEVAQEGAAKSTAKRMVEVVNENMPIETKGILSHPLGAVSPAIMEDIRNVRMRFSAALADYPVMKEPRVQESGAITPEKPWELVDMERVIGHLDLALKAKTVGEMMAHLKPAIDWIAYSKRWAAEAAGNAGSAWEKDHLSDGVIEGLKDRPWVRFFALNPNAWDERISKILFGNSLAVGSEEV